MVLTGSILAIIGSLMIASYLIVAGYIAIIAGSALFLGNQSLHWNDSTKLEHLRKQFALPNGLADQAMEELYPYLGEEGSAGFTPSAPPCTDV
jgi:hypothetical protein